MTMISVNSPAANCVPVSTRFSVFATLKQMNSVWRQRQVLKNLDAAALDDIGLTRAQAHAEAKRAVWDAPESWTC